MLEAERRSTRWNNAQGRRVIRAWQESGLDLAAFALQHGLSEKRLRRWSTRFGPPPVSCEPAPEFVEAELAVREEPTVKGSTPLEVLCPTGHVLCVRDGVSGEVLAQVLAVLGCAP